MDGSVSFLKPTKNKGGIFCGAFLSLFLVFGNGLIQSAVAVIPTPKTGSGLHTLEEALGQTYTQNPELDAERAKLRSLDEGVAQAFSGWRPEINGQLNQVNSRTQQGSDPEAGARRRGGNVILKQNIFAGGGTLALTQKAENEVWAGRQNLVSEEQKTLLSAVQAYMEVLTRGKTLELLRESEKVLESTVLQANARYEVGEGTRTEVAAAQAQKAAATARKVSAEGELETARANFTKIVGRPPGRLVFPKVLIPLPKGQSDAITMALKNNPALVASTFQEKAATHSVDAYTAGLLPKLDFSAAADRAVVARGGTARALTARLELTVPLYDQGSTQSKVRQAEQGVAAAKLNTKSARSSVVESTTKAWASHASAREALEQYKLQVSAAKLALDGVREEYSLGQKSLLDVLQVEEEWRKAVISLAEAEQNVLVLSYQLLAATGQMTVAALNVNVPRYDPNKYYEEYSGAWFGLGREEDQHSFHHLQEPPASP